MKKSIYSLLKFTALISTLILNTGTVFAQGFSKATQDKLQQVLETFKMTLDLLAVCAQPSK